MDTGWALALIAIAAFAGYKFGKGSSESDKLYLRRENTLLKDELAEATKLNEQFDKSWDELEAQLEVCRSEKRSSASASKNRNRNGAARQKLTHDESVENPIPAAKLAGPPPVVQAEHEPTTVLPKIQTRTGTMPAGSQLLDNWKEKSDWDEYQDRELKQLVNAGKSVSAIALQMQLDQKDIAYRVTRLYFDIWGDLDEIELAPNNQTTWLNADKTRVFKMHGQHRSLDDMATAVGRTKIAIGWKLINSRQISF